MVWSWLALLLLVLSIDDKCIDHRHVHKPQKDSLVELSTAHRLLQRVALQPQLVVNVDPTHPTMVVTYRRKLRWRCSAKFVCVLLCPAIHFKSNMLYIQRNDS
ncbi:hypothetical protein PF011_g23919 [Phytophthora fragariae]|uniref:RxLR effector protein n=1 Tax=Phytophthora fragariae TaxID=53985 RepID=A0A6A3I9R3_9STRA|nr:hypothetical protein PF011_g23919 [Phytophthora fragariae]